MTVVINTVTGKTGDYTAWVAAFAELWRGGRLKLDEFMSILSPRVRLSAPGLKSTQGWDECKEAFRRTFEVFPDLTANVDRWSAQGEVLFIEMTFSATIGGRVVKWTNVDRFLFHDGQAVERVAFFNPAKVQRAFLRGPKGWRQLWRRLRSGL